jgi:uncharacterized protein YpmS
MNPMWWLIIILLIITIVADIVVIVMRVISNRERKKVYATKDKLIELEKSFSNTSSDILKIKEAISIVLDEYKKSEVLMSDRIQFMETHFSTIIQVLDKIVTVKENPKDGGNTIPAEESTEVSPEE